MTGTPQLVSAQTTAGQDDCLAVLLSRADAASVGDIVLRMLEQFEAAAVIVFCPLLRVVIGTTDAATATALLDGWNEGGGGELRAAPTDARMKATWSVVSDTLSDAALSDAAINVYQRRSVNGLVNFVSAQRVFTNQPELAVLVNQIAGQVAFKLHDGSLSWAIESLAPAGQTVCVRFEMGKTKRIFE